MWRNTYIVLMLQILLFAVPAIASESECSSGPNQNDTSASGVNVQINFGNSTEMNKQMTNIYNINSCKDSCQKGAPSWSGWSTWSDCSKTCGGGNTTRERKCMASSDNSASPGQQQEVDTERCCGSPEEEGPCGTMKCPGNILLIVGGKTYEGDGVWKSTDKAYALSLNRKVDVPRCLESICDFDHYVTYPTTAIFQDGLPTVCGGTDYTGTPFTSYVECFKYNFTDAWTYSGSLEHTHGYAHSYHEGWGMVMIADNWMQVSADGDSFATWNRGVPQEYHVGGFCQVAIDENLIFVAGGWKAAEDSSTFIFDLRSGWRKLPDMIRGRHSMMCGLVTDRRGNKKIVIAGGHSAPDYTWTNNGDNRHVESFDLQTEEWSSEPPFPFTPVGRSTNIPYGNSFLSIGGCKSENEAVNSIYTYDPDTSAWIMLSASLETPLMGVGAFLMDENEIPC